MKPSRTPRLNAAPKRIARRPAARKPRRPAEDTSAAAIWIAGILALLLVAFGVIWWETPAIKAYFAGSDRPAPVEEPLPSEEPLPPPKPAPPSVPKPTAEELQMKRLEKKVEAETQELVERPAPTLSPAPAPAPAPPPVQRISPPALLPPPPIASDAKPSSPTGPLTSPSAQPQTDARVPAATGAPVRALPVDPAKLDTERIAAYQVALERIHFSCGFIDGDQGMRTQRMLRAFQASRGLPTSGFLDQPTRDAIGEPGEPFLNYVVTAADIASIMPKPTSWREKSQAARLGYNDMWEMLAEKFHCTRAYLKGLNHDVKQFVAGTEVIGPKVYPASPIPKAASLRIYLSETSIEALDASGKVVGFFPCSIAKDKNKRPSGELTVKSIVPNPDYTFDPALFADAAKAEGLTKKMVLPPGPRNPVGTTWIGLSLPGYGIHGTPEPENISRTQSHGCFRLANWNAEKVLKMVKVGTPVDVQP